MSRVYDQREDLHAARKREGLSLPHHPQEGRDRRITEQSKAKKEDRVLAILKQAQQLSYRDFKRLSNILGVNANDADQAVEDGVMMIEEEQDK